MKTNFILNEEFFSIPLYVDKRVLTPRNDTETMIYQVLKDIKPWFSLIDVWTWSWAIIISILKNINFDLVSSFWVDISEEALDVANINIKYHSLQDKIKLQKSDLLCVFFDKLNYYKISQNLILTANLPYIKNSDIYNIDKEVLLNDPHVALFWWPKTWFEMYERLIKQVFQLKKIYNIKNLILYIEIWFDQYDYSKKYLSDLWLSFEYFKDLNNIYRIIKINF